MPRARHEWLGQIKAVERECSAMRLAIDRLRGSAKVDPSLIGEELTLRDLADASSRLDGTYVIRLFAEFETALRRYWSTARRTNPPSRARDLLNGVAATRQIPQGRLSLAHEVREYRNSLVHERDGENTPIPVAEAREYLCRYLTHMPPMW